MTAGRVTFVGRVALPILPLDRHSSLTDVRLDMLCRYVAGRDVDPVAREAALVGCVLMARGDEAEATRVVSRAERALGWWDDEPLDVQT
jgi:hypothetical protein